MLCVSSRLHLVRCPCSARALVRTFHVSHMLYTHRMGWHRPMSDMSARHRIRGTQRRHATTQLGVHHRQERCSQHTGYCCCRHRTSATSTSAAATPARCTEHAQPVILFCTRDRTLICACCVCTTHVGHPLMELAHAHARITSYLAAVSSHLSHCLASHRDVHGAGFDLLELQLSLPTTTSSIRERIAAYMSTQHAALDAREAKLDQQLHTMQMELTRQIEEKRNSNTERQQQATQLQRSIQQIVPSSASRSTPCSLLEHTDVLQDTRLLPDSVFTAPEQPPSASSASTSTSTSTSSSTSTFPSLQLHAHRYTSFRPVTWDYAAQQLVTPWDDTQLTPGAITWAHDAPN